MPPEAKKTFRHVSRIEVHLWGNPVGRLAMDPGTGFYAFRYDPSFPGRGIEPAPLQMPVDEQRTLVFPDLSPRTFQRLPAMVGDSLPDRFGNRLIEESLRSYGVDPDAITTLDRLAYLSHRTMGALQFKPPRGEVEKASAIELETLVSEARRAVHERLDEGNSSEALKHIISVGISAGGARPKAVICWNPETGELRSGQFDAPEGFQHWLLKFDGIEEGQLGAPRVEGRVEYAYSLMAKAAGIAMTECRLHEEGGRAHFMTRRFDREGSATRHHIQTLCAMAHMDFGMAGAYSYGQLFETILKLGLPDHDLEQAFRRMAFNVLARNLDDHTKNVSFRLKQGGGWELAPAYDLTFAHNPDGAWNHQHFLSVNGRRDGIGREDLLLEGERYSIGRARSILDEVRAAVSRWNEFRDEAGIPTETATRMERQFVRV